MNKKFYTLVASILLAGGLFSAADAINVKSVQPGQYFRLDRVGEIAHDATAWSTDASLANGYFLTWDKDNKNLLLAQNGKAGVQDSTSRYWTVLSYDQQTGEIELQSLNGKKLAFTYKDKTQSFYAYSPVQGNDAIQLLLHPKSELATKDLSLGQDDDNTIGYHAIAVRNAKDKNNKVKGELFTFVAGANALDASDAKTPSVGGTYQIVVAEKAITNSTGALGVYSEGSETSMWTVKQNDKGYYSFVNAKGETLAIDDSQLFEKVGTGYEGLILKSVTTGKYIGINAQTDALVLTDKTQDAVVLSYEYVGDDQYSVAELIHFEKTGFSLTIATDANFKKTSIDGNVFSGRLTPMTWSATAKKFEAVETGKDGVLLKNEDGKYIVLDTKDKWANTNENYGCKFKLVSEDTLKEQFLGKAGDNNNRYNAYFKVFHSYAYDGTSEKVSYITVAATKNATTSESQKVGYLDVNSKPSLSAEDEVAGKHYLLPVYIKIGDSQVVDWTKFLKKNEYAVITIVNDGTTDNKTAGYALGIKPGNSLYGAYCDWVKSAVNELELQWAVTYNTDTKKYTLTNRENPQVTITNIDGNIFYNGAAANQYKYENHTVSIKFVDGEATDGYTTLDPIALKNQHYYVAIQQLVSNAQIWLSENHKDAHTIGLVDSKENANEWTVVPQIAKRELTKDENFDKFMTPSDSVYVISTIGYYDADAKQYDTTQDTLKIPSYSLQNVTYNEYIKEYRGNTESYACDTKKEEDALRFAVRKSGDYVNLVPVAYNVNKIALEDVGNGEGLYQHLSYGKIYAGSSVNGGLLNNMNLYSQTENDLFVLEAAEAPEYKTLAQGDTIRLFREEDNSQVLYEKGEFASIGNAAALKDINPALYVDTAWMNRVASVNRYDYLLAVDVNRIDTTYKCNVPSHSHLFHNADTTYGRFLVNLSDSVDVYDDINNIHVNRYFYNEMPRLAFKPGFHTEDKLFFTTATDTVAHEVGNANLCIAKFAFKMVDDENFVIETAAKEEKNPADNVKGYLVWVNGNLVVADDSKGLKPEVFSLADDKRTPTANEAIDADATVSVVAANGAVIIKNAAGKKVAIKNILGKSIANETISSDNETIAVPAGIVVVAVEGEEAVKVVVK